MVMKKNQGILNSIKLFAIAATLFFLASCTTEEEMVKPAEVQTETETTTAAASEEAEIASFTLSGIYTDVLESVECATCTYIVPAHATTVDGKELGFAPGTVICLDKAIKYNAIEFVNLEGTAEKPITISYCAK
jgi:hypothetical protein